MKIKTLFAGLSVGVLSLSVFSGCNSNSESTNGFLATNVQLYSPAQLSQFVADQKLTREQVLESIESLQASLKSSYVGYNLKKNLIGKSGDEIFAQCKKTVARAPEKMNSFELYDMVLQCLAGFKDSHLNLVPKLSPAYVTSGVSEIKLLEGKFYIARIRIPLLKKLEEMQKLAPDTLVNALKPGVEVLAIDGKNPMEAARENQKYDSSSSEGASLNSAIETLFTRTFNYPKSKEVKLSLKLADGSTQDLVLPWVVHTMTSSTIESRTVLNQKGLLDATEMSGADKNFMQSTGLNENQPLFKKMSSAHSYYDSKNSLQMVTGIPSINGKSVCYLRLNTLDFEEDPTLLYKLFEPVNGKPFPVSFIAITKDFLASCNAFQAPVILDLRNNGGGDAKAASFFYGLFENPSTLQIFGAKARQLEAGNFAFLNNMLNDADNKEATLEENLTFASVQEAMTTKQKTTAWLLTRNENMLTNVFAGKVVVLTSPACVSACESTANRFKLSGRAKILGEPTNGTGFGFLSTQSGETNFRDPFNLYQVKVPNMAFQSIVIQDSSTFQNEKKIKAALLAFDKLALAENRPTQPDIEINYTLNDLQNEFADYIKKLAKVIAPATANQ